MPLHTCCAGSGLACPLPACSPSAAPPAVAASTVGSSAWIRACCQESTDSTPVRCRLTCSQLIDKGLHDHLQTVKEPGMAMQLQPAGLEVPRMTMLEDGGAYKLRIRSALLASLPTAQPTSSVALPPTDMFTNYSHSTALESLQALLQPTLHFHTQGLPATRLPPHCALPRPQRCAQTAGC